MVALIIAYGGSALTLVMLGLMVASEVHHSGWMKGFDAAQEIYVKHPEASIIRPQRRRRR